MRNATMLVLTSISSRYCVREIEGTITLPWDSDSFSARVADVNPNPDQTTAAAGRWLAGFCAKQFDVGALQGYVAPVELSPENCIIPWKILETTCWAIGDLFQAPLACITQKNHKPRTIHCSFLLHGNTNQGWER